jgi:hypothetical protein
VFVVNSLFSSSQRAVLDKYARKYPKISCRSHLLACDMPIGSPKGFQPLLPLLNRLVVGLVKGLPTHRVSRSSLVWDVQFLLGG